MIFNQRSSLFTWNAASLASVYVVGFIHFCDCVLIAVSKAVAISRTSHSNWSSSRLHHVWKLYLLIPTKAIAKLTLLTLHLLCSFCCHFGEVHGRIALPMVSDCIYSELDGLSRGLLSLVARALLVHKAATMFAWIGLLCIQGKVLAVEALRRVKLILVGA